MSPSRQSDLSSAPRTGREGVWLKRLSQRMMALFRRSFGIGARAESSRERLVLHYRGQRRVLERSSPPFRVGRSRCNELVVNHEFVSRQHAVIEYRQGRFTLTDHSKNGTHLLADDEARVFLRHEPVTLRQKGVVCLGDKRVERNPHLIHYRVVPGATATPRRANRPWPRLRARTPENPVDPIDRALTQLDLSPAVQRFRALTVFPLLAEASVRPAYLTLGEALRRETARIGEISEQGSVPELRFENLSDAPVLLVDGEEVVGMKQNRIVNITILIDGHQTRTIPVSCVERGRWGAAPRGNGASGHQHYFQNQGLTIAGGIDGRGNGASGHQHYFRARARKAEQVSVSLIHSGSRHSDQGAIWRDIDEKFTALQGHSRTGAMADLYEQVADRLGSYIGAFHPRPLQVGAVFAIRDRIAGVEVFDSDRTFASFFGNLVRSYALDALEQESVESMASDLPTPADARRFLHRVRDAQQLAYPALGKGEDIRLAGDVSGGALIADGRVVHLAAFDRAEV